MERTELASLIEKNIGKIVEDWVKSVQADATIVSSEDLSEGGIRDHLPQVLEEIVALVRANAMPNVFNTREARVSAYTRYTQNYRISDLITEIALLRRIIFHYIYQFILNEGANLDLYDYIRTANLINAYLDEEMRYGGSIFCESVIKNNN